MNNYPQSTSIQKCIRRLHLTLASFLAALVIAFFLSSNAAWAANGTWLDTGSTDATWSTSSNWLSGVVPGANSGTTNVDIATFNTALGTYGTSGTPILIDSGRNLKFITFDLAAVGAYFIGTTGGNALHLTGGGGITMNAAVVNTETINAPLVVEGAGGSLALTNNATSSSALLNIGGDITGGAAGLTVLILGGSNTGNNTISGNISKGSATNISVTKNDAGTWVLSGSNTFSATNNTTNALLVNSGTLNIQGATTVSPVGKVTVLAGSTLDVSGAGTFAATGGNNTPVTIGGGLLLNDTGATQKTNRFSGAFTLSGSGASFSYLGNASNDSTETNTGGIALGNGLFTITVSYGGAKAATVTEANITRTASTSGLALINGVNLGANTIALGSVGQFITTTGPTLVGTTVGGSTGINTGVKDTKVALFLLGESGTGTTQKGTATGVANTFLTYNGTTGYRPLNPTDEFTNNSIVVNNNTYLTTGTTTTSGATAINSLVVNGGNLEITGGTLTNTSGMLLFAQSGTISGAGTFTLGGSSNQEGFIALNPGVNARISSVLGAGTTGLTITGPGTLTISGSNSYGGTTGLALGSTLVIGNNNALGLSSLSLAGGTIQGDGQSRAISNTLVETANGGVIGGSGNLTFAGGGTVNTPALTVGAGVNITVKVNNTGITTFSGVFSLLNAASGANNAGKVFDFGSSANVVITGPIQDNNAGNAAVGSGFGILAFTGVGANLTISPTVSNNAYGATKATTIVSSAAYNTVTIGGPGGTGATITPFGAGSLNFQSPNPVFFVAEKDGQILGNNVITNASLGLAFGFSGTNSMTLGGSWTAGGNASNFYNMATGTFTFGNTISGNSLTIQGSGNTTLNSSATLAAGAFAFNATQTGTMTLSNVNNFTGVTTFNGGTVVLDYSTNNNTKLTQNSAAGSAAALSLGGVDLQLSGGSFAQTLGTPSSSVNGTTLNAGQSRITQTNLGSSTIALGGITRSAGSAIDFQTGVASTTTAVASGILGGYATVGGTDWAVSGASGANPITALSSYDSFATPGTNKNILQTDNGNVAASGTINSLKITTSTASQSLTITTGTLSLTSGGLLFTGGNNYSITGGALRPTTSGGDFIVQQYGSGTLQIDSVLSANGGSTLTKAGTGTLVLTGPNTYTGATYINGGILQISANNNLGTTGAINFNGGTLETTASFSTSRAISLSTNGATFQVDTGTLTSTGVISGVGYKALTKTGAGTLLLQGANTFFAPVTVSGGTLQLGNASALGASSTASNRAMTPVLVNGGTLDINGQTTALGNVTLQNGAISDTAGTGSLAAYSFNLQSGTVGAKLVDLVLSGNPNGNGINLYKTTSGTATLTAASTYTGNTNIQNGVLVVNGFLANTHVSVGDGTATTRTPTLSGTGSIAGLVTTQVNGSNVAHLAPGVNTSGNTGAIGTLTLSNGLTIGAGTNLDYDLAGSSSGDLIRISGGTLTLTSGITLNIADAGSLGDGTFTLFNYSGATLSGFSPSDFSIGTTPLAGKSYTFADTGSTITLTISGSGAATATTYTLTASAGSTNILTGGTTNITSTITNTGTGSADTLNYTGLGAGSGAGGSITGSTTSGTGLAHGVSGTNGQVFTGTQSGAVVVTPVGTGSNATAGGAATATGTTSVTVNVFDPASLSGVQSGTGTVVALTALNQSGTFRASAKVTADNGLSNNQGFTNVAVTPGTQIDPGNSVTVASFDKTNRLNGTYTAQKGLGYDNVTSSGSAITGGTGNTANVGLSVTVSGQTAGAGQAFNATLFSGQKYGTTTGSTSSGYGLTSAIAGDPHTGTTATLINGTASANTTVSMSFNTVPSAGAIHDTTFRTSDILSLGGIVATGTLGPDHSVLTDKYVLQLSYDPSAVGAQYIGWYDADQSQWVNAIAGNSTGGHYDGSGEFFGSYAAYLATLTGPQQANLTFQLNAFGYDVSTHTAWAVVDHNSEFAVIPEPSTWGMILSGFGMLIGIQRLRRRRVGT